MSEAIATSKAASLKTGGPEMSLPTGGEISKLLKSEGPVVTAVLLKAGPQAEVCQIKVDTTPQKQMVKQILGGPFTFLGQYEEEGVVLMCRKNEGAANSLAKNQHKLQPPFDSSEVLGDILILKVAAEEDESQDLNSSIAAKSNDEFFLNYTEEDYSKFAARTDVVVPANVSMESEEEDNEEEEEEEEEMEGESDDEDEAAGFLEMLMGQVLQKFEQDNGRAPTEAELQALQAAIAQKMGGLS